MKKIILCLFLFMFTLAFSGIRTHAENLSYPFEAITISQAMTFQVLVPSGINETSLLYGLVTEGEIITIYVATIWFTEIGGIVNGSSSRVLIVSNAEGEDLVRFIVNSASAVPDVERFDSFASHILIYATMGVFKDMESIDPILGIQHLTVHHVFADNQLTFIDNNGVVMPMITGSYEMKTDLDIVISTNTGGGA